MKVIVAVLALAVSAVRGSYNPFYHGYNPYAALQALGLYNPYVAPAPQVPFSGTYAYHDGHRPTVVQANNDGYAFPHAINSLNLWNPWNPAWAGSVAAASSANYHAPVAPQKTVVQANLGSAESWKYGYYGHGQPQKTVVQANLGGGVVPWNYAFYGLGHGQPQKTIVQANLGAADPWKYGAFYGTGIYGIGFSNYSPVVRLA